MKVLEGDVFFNGKIEDLPKYNKNQIIHCVCAKCNQQFTIKYVNLKSKSSILCRACAISESDYTNRGQAISEAKQRIKQSETEPQKDARHQRLVLAQTSRSQQDKQTTIDKYRATMAKKSVEELKQRSDRMKAARASWSPEKKLAREQKFKDTLFKNSLKKFQAHSIKLIQDRGYNYKEISNLLYELGCPKCGTTWKWTNYIYIDEDSYSQIPYCPKCVHSLRSHYEDLLCNMFQGINFIKNDRTLLNGKELDLYFPEYKLAIEFDGIYFHNNSKKSLEKSELCKQKGVRLINIIENEFDPKKVQSILYAAVGIRPKRKVYARKCVIKEIDSKMYADFCEANHLQGSSPAAVKLGLFFNDELVEIESYSKPRFSKKYEWEMIRECSLNDIAVIGGKAKLFKYFITHYNPHSIVSYCDKRWFTGDSYIGLGFKLEDESKPSYFYTNGKVVLSRYQCQKHKLSKVLSKYDEASSEYDNMLSNGYYRIYDFGQKVFKWTN